MRTLRLLLAAGIGAIVVLALRDLERGRWLAPAIPRRAVEPDGREPLLGYDGMDQETLLDWIEESDLDEEMIEDIITYEQANRRREPVLSALEELLG